MSTAAAPDGTTVPAAVRRYTMVVLAVVYMFNFIDRQILAILLPAIREEFRVGDTVLGLLAGTAFALFYVTLGIPAGRLADRFNRRNLIAAALAVWSGMTALSGLATQFWHLVAARVGVGVGEAGCSPPAHSMIADLYPPEQRSSAMGFYALGISAGIMLALMVGWREAFFIVGLPGLALALLVRLTVVEPVRGGSEVRIDSGRAPGIRQVLAFLVRRRSFAWLAVGAGLCALSGYAIVNWMPSFLARSFGVPIATVGFWLGLVYGVAGGAGFFLGGYLADRIGRGGHRRALRFIAAAVILTAACNVAVFLSASLLACLLLFIIPAVTSNFYLAPALGLTQSLASLRMRSLASAVLLLVVNLIGLALGSLVTGAVSDALQDAAGEESLRYSLLAVSSVVLPLAAGCFALAARSIDADLARSGEHD